MLRLIKYYIVLIYLVYKVSGAGLLILYRPKDLTNACISSKYIRFDLSFGMGMSDTITLVFRTFNEIDYDCEIEIVTDSANTDLLVVLRYPNSLYINCMHNPDAFMVLKQHWCSRVCDFLKEGRRSRINQYLVFTVVNRARFRFNSNSSLNTAIGAHLYQVTVTTARAKPKEGCHQRNETICVIASKDYCFTSGVVCDGIKNCGVENAFDERKSECTLNLKRLGMAPVIAVVALFIFMFVAAGHLLVQCLPPLANSFFIFNANEDNRLCIDPVLSPSGNPPDVEPPKRTSIIPVSSSSSSEYDQREQRSADDRDDFELSRQGRINTLRSVTEKLQSKMKLVTAFSKRRK